MYNFETFIYGSFKHNKNGYSIVSYSQGFNKSLLSNNIISALDSIGYFTEEFSDDGRMSYKINDDCKIICKFNYNGIDFIGRKHCMVSYGILIDKNSFDKIEGNIEDILNKISLVDINDISSSINIPSYVLNSINNSYSEDEKSLLKIRKHDFVKYISSVKNKNNLSFPLLTENKEIINLIYKIIPNDIKWDINFSDFLNNKNNLNLFNLSCATFIDKINIPDNYEINSADEIWALDIIENILNPFKSKKIINAPEETKETSKAIKVELIVDSDNIQTEEPVIKISKLKKIFSKLKKIFSKK
jgi:hypothetical protein